MNAFDCHLAATRWFRGDVLWLDPEPATPFDHLTTAVWQAFPEHPPYGRTHEKVVPHLTLAQLGPAGLAMLRAVEQAVQPHLPIPAHIEQALLIAGSAAPNSWRILHALPLGDAGMPGPWSAHSPIPSQSMPLTGLRLKTSLSPASTAGGLPRVDSCSTPVLRRNVGDRLGERPVMAGRIVCGILPLAVSMIGRLAEDGSAGRKRILIVGFDVIDPDHYRVGGRVVSGGRAAPVRGIGNDQRSVA